MALTEVTIHITMEFIIIKFIKSTKGELILIYFVLESSKGHKRHFSFTVRIR